MSEVPLVAWRAHTVSTAHMVKRRLAKKNTHRTSHACESQHPPGYRGTSLIRNSLPLGPYSRSVPRAHRHARSRVSCVTTQGESCITTQGHECKCQNATFRFVALNQCT